MWYNWKWPQTSSTPLRKTTQSQRENLWKAAAYDAVANRFVQCMNSGHWVHIHTLEHAKTHVYSRTEASRGPHCTAQHRLQPPAEKTIMTLPTTCLIAIMVQSLMSKHQNGMRKDECGGAVKKMKDRPKSSPHFVMRGSQAAAVGHLW